MFAAVLAAGGSYFAEPERPAAVILATDTLIKPWEGLVLKSHWDRFAGIYDICHGETRINGKPVQPGMSFTAAECDAILEKRVYNDYYLPLTKQIKGFTRFPVSVQASMISGAYNFGVSGMVNSTAARLAVQGKYREACIAQTAWNKAGGQVVGGLVKRREMGDAQRAGEAEVCVSGIEP
jgi:GH24 family phage-related lysozyme (muramidase)